MPDVSVWMNTPYDWILLFDCALLIGMSKTGIQGITTLVIPLMAINFGAKPSTGLILPMLCFSDLIAVFLLSAYSRMELYIQITSFCDSRFFSGISGRQTYSFG
ncbi:MAG: hypothetical protein LIP04_07495 [Tannerellaceae bacterium]|nr:hypothetical protein [Tannerellaceae bacterium]